MAYAALNGGGNGSTKGFTLSDDGTYWIKTGGEGYNRAYGPKVTYSGCTYAPFVDVINERFYISDGTYWFSYWCGLEIFSGSINTTFYGAGETPSSFSVNGSVGTYGKQHAGGGSYSCSYNSSIGVNAHVWITASNDSTASIVNGCVFCNTPEFDITFNDNGGSGGPGTLTKKITFNGKNVATIPTTVPTRSHYEFLGWSTSATNATNKVIAYQPGDSYSENGDTTLYASWNLLHERPTITDVLCKRVTAENSTTTSDDSKYGYVTFKYSVDTEYSSSNKATVNVKYKVSGATSYTTLVSNTTLSSSGTCQYWSNAVFATDSSYDILITVVDASGISGENTTTYSDYISTAFFTLDFKAGGHGIAFGQPSSEDNFSCNMDAVFKQDTTFESPVALPTGTTVGGKTIEITNKRWTFYEKAGGTYGSLSYYTVGQTTWVTCAIDTLLQGDDTWTDYLSLDGDGQITFKIGGMYHIEYIGGSWSGAGGRIGVGCFNGSVEEVSGFARIAGTPTFSYDVTVAAGESRKIKSYNESSGTASVYYGASYKRLTIEYLGAVRYEIANQVSSDAVILYSNTSGTTSAITLSETSANFRFIEIYYSKAEGTYSYTSTKVYLPNGKNFCLFLMNRASDGSTWQQLVTYVTCSGTTLTPHTFYYNNDNASGYGTDSSPMKIYYVIGYR